MPTPVNQATFYLIKHFESFRGKAYRCPAGVWTIGWGHTGDVEEGQCIDRDEAGFLLLTDVQKTADAIEPLILFELNENQFGALVSFAFNAGLGNFRNSTLLRRLNQGDLAAVPGQLKRWVFITNPVTRQKEVSNGLLRRREAEAALWQTEPGELMPQTAEE
ncbi:MAG: lysozyme [Magnetococcales bacterium]|nr:lysozyme [Magnetococcales bacterium]